MTTEAKIENINFDGTCIDDRLVADYMRKNGKTDDEIKEEAIRMYNREASTELGRNCGLTYGQEKRLAYKFIKQFLTDRILASKTKEEADYCVKMMNELDVNGFFLEETDITLNYEGGLKHILYC